MSLIRLVAGRWGTGSGEVDDVSIDKTTNDLTTSTHTGAMVHCGDYFYIEGYITLNDTDTLYVKLITPNTTEWAHFQWEINASGILTTELYEAPTGGMTGGTGVTPLNSNRNSANTSAMTITSGVVAPTATGTTVSSVSVGSTGFKTVVGGSTDQAHEMILKQNATYCRKFLSGSDANVISFRASWGEITNKR